MTSSPDGFSTWATFPGWPHLSEGAEISRQWNMASPPQPRVRLGYFSSFSPLTGARFSWRAAPGFGVGVHLEGAGSWHLEELSSCAIIWLNIQREKKIPSWDQSILPSQILRWDESLSWGISLPSWHQELRRADGRTGNIQIQGIGCPPGQLWGWKGGFVIP